MALIDLDFEIRLRTLIKLNEEKLQLRLAGGDLMSVRRDEFLTTNYKDEELVNPSGGIYNAQKNLDEWMRLNTPPPGEDQDKVKKIMWRQFSKEMSKEISKNVVDWLNKDVMGGLAREINDQIKLADITITVPPTSVLIPLPPPALTGPTITGTPIPPTNVTIS